MMHYTRVIINYSTFNCFSHPFSIVFIASQMLEPGESTAYIIGILALMLARKMLGYQAVCFHLTVGTSMIDYNFNGCLIKKLPMKTPCLGGGNELFMLRFLEN
jgi:hypothetical protein